MLIGVPREIKSHENRVGMIPASVLEVISHGHQVIVETNAGAGIGFLDEDYVAVGAEVAPDAKTVFDRADMIVKVKEPQPGECRMLREGQILFAYLHLAPDPVQAELLGASGCSAVAYETVTDVYGGLPLLAPMSQVAGRMSIQAGAHCLERSQGGAGVLLGGVPGVAAANVVVIGGGVVGVNAIHMAIGMQARVTVLDKSLRRLQELNYEFGPRLNTIYSTQDAITHYVANADLVIGAVLVPGASAPRLVTREMLGTMRKGSVIVDVAIDQGGCFETSKPTTHDNPTYIVDDIVHYCVANMPGGVPKTSTFALNNATLPFIVALANKGLKQALLDDPHLMAGLNVYNGKITNLPVAQALSKEYHPAPNVLS